MMMCINAFNIGCSSLGHILVLILLMQLVSLSGYLLHMLETMTAATTSISKENDS